MKEQFLDLTGLTDVIKYLQICITQHKLIIPLASFSVFPKVGDENNIYIDTSNNNLYRWDGTNNKYVQVAKADQKIILSSGAANGQVSITVNGEKQSASVYGLKSAAYTESTSYASAAQGTKADSAIQTITISSGTNNGTVKVTVNGVTTDNIKVTGLGSAAFSDIGTFATKSHTHIKSEVGLGSVDNTADKDKSVKFASSAGSVDWENVQNKPTSYTPTSHSHDDKYYTKGQVDSKLGGKSDTGHTHSQFTQETKFSNDTFTDPLPNTSVAIKASGGIATDLIYEGGSTLSSKYQPKGNYAANSHTHDDRYYTESEIDSKLSGKANSSHTHTKDQVGLGNVDNTSDSAKNVNYANSAGTASSVADSGEATADIARHVWFSNTDPESKRVYSEKFKYNPATNVLTVGSITGSASSAASVQWSGVQNKPTSYTPSAHTHDDRYYTESEINSKLSGKANSSHSHGNGDITSLDASKLTGTINIDRLPAGALERCVIVDTESDRLKLTTATVQKGDTVKVVGSDKMYFVIDDTKLSSEAGYTVYTAGSATSVPWSGITGIPSTFTPSSHTHSKSQITDFPSSLPASDVYAWAKAASKPSYSKSEVGLGNVDNTADSAKSVKYATSAGSAGSSTKATQDSEGQQINSTYIKSLAVNGRTITYTKGDNTTGTITTQDTNTVYTHPSYSAKTSGLYKITVDGTGHVSGVTSVTKADITGLGIPGQDTNTDTKVTQSAVKSSDYTNWRTIIWGSSNSTTEGFTPTSVTDGVFSDPNLTYQPSTGTLRAITFKGNLSGNATSASSVAWGNVTGKPSTFTPSSHSHNYAGSSSAGGSANSAAKLDTATAGSATQPVYFSGGKPVATTYSLNKTVPADAKFTDTNTWRGVQNNLTSDATDQSLSAAQGKVLKGLVDGKAASSHTHTIAQISNLQSTLDGKSNTNHTHDLNSMINTLTNGTSDPVDTDYYIAQYAGGGSTTTTYHRRPHSALWNYIKSKANSVYQPKGSYAASSHTHDDRYYTESEINTKLASKSDTSHTHNYVVGSYTSNGGQQKPNYFGTNKVGFLMMNTTVNGNSQYKDWIIMDCYSGNDVGGGVAIGVNRQSLGAYIMRSDSSRSSWASAELLHTGNYTTYTVTKNGSGASGTWGINVTGSAGSVAWGNVSGRPSSLPASDVYSWAKASTKPSYSYTEITNRPTLIKAVSKNGYWGMADHDGSDSNWIRTTTSGIIPYQSGGAGAGHCGIGTSSWYFSNAYIDTVNCVNASVSGHIDVGGYIQSSNLINTYFEYQSNRGSVDWRFGSATGSGDQNWFGFYDYTYGYHGGIYGPGHLLRMGGEIQSTAANGFRAVQGNYGFIIRNDGSNVYFMMTGNGDPWGGWNDNYTTFTPNGEWQIKKSPYDNGMPTSRGYAVVSDSNADRVYSISNYNASYLKVRGGLGTYHCTYSNSDIRLKKNIENTSVTNALSVINSIKVRQFDWKETNIHQSIGFVADELEKLDPNFSQGGGVTKDGGIDVKSVNSFYLQGYIVKALQELSSQVSVLKQENKRLKQKLNMCN